LFSDAVVFVDQKPEDIRQAIENLLSDTTAACNLGAASRRLYEQHFDLPVTLAALTERRVVTAAECDMARSA
jgi:hypothetical protein